MSQQRKIEAAQAALAEVRSGMTLGLGTGSLRESYDAIVEHGGAWLDCRSIERLPSTTTRPYAGCAFYRLSLLWGFGPLLRLLLFLLSLLLILLRLVLLNHRGAPKNHDGFGLTIRVDPGIDAIPDLQVAEFLRFGTDMDIRLLAILVLDDELLTVDGDDVHDKVLGFLHRTFRRGVRQQSPYAQD